MNNFFLGISAVEKRELAGFIGTSEVFSVVDELT